MIGTVPISGPILHTSSTVYAFKAAHGPVGLHRQQLNSCRCSWMLSRRRTVLVRAEEEPEAGNIPSPVKDDVEEEDPIWVRREKMRDIQGKEGWDLPFPVYLLGAGVAAIGAVGSVFEFFNQRPVFGVIEPSSPFWLPILALFALTGLPLSGWMFFRAVESANKQAEQMDEVDKA